MRLKGLACAAIAILASGLAAAEPPVRTQDLRDARSNQVPGIAPFPSDESTMALNTLVACLAAYNLTIPFQRLVFVSEAAFTFVYDTTDAYEPLGDLFPIDLLGTACSNLGFPDARWYTGGSIEEIKALVKRQIDGGHPVITSFLDSDAFRGFSLIVGYDYDSNVFYLQGSRRGRDSTYAATPIPEHWTGPTAAPTGWADNPVFVIGMPGSEQSPGLSADSSIVALGITLIQGGRLTYGNNPGERAFMRTPGPHEAAYGLPAYRLLSWDVGNGKLIVDAGSGEEVNLGLVWRINNQLDQLEKYRDHAAESVDFIANLDRSGHLAELRDLAGNLQKTSTEAAALRTMFWDVIPNNIRAPDSIVKYVDASSSLVFSFAGRDKYFQNLQDRGLQVFKTRSGPVIVQDLPERRLEAKLLARGLESRERTSLTAMKEAVSYIRPELEKPEAPVPGARPRFKGGKNTTREEGEPKVQQGSDPVGQ